MKGRSFSMTKKDLKVGMVVETTSKNGTGLAMITVSGYTGPELCLSGEFDWFPLDCMDDDLTYGHCEITKVYGLCGYNRNAYKLDIIDRKLLWERPTYYNGKVVCVDNERNPNCYTVGKIYQFKDGVITTDDGWKFIGNFNIPFKSFEEFAKWTGSKFIEVVE